MEMILNENDLVVGARFDNGTIQDYIDENKTYGLVRIEESTANWFLFNKDESEDDLQKLYKKVLKEEHFIQNDFTRIQYSNKLLLLIHVNFFKLAIYIILNL